MDELEEKNKIKNELAERKKSKKKFTEVFEFLNESDNGLDEEYEKLNNEEKIDINNESKELANELIDSSDFDLVMAITDEKVDELIPERDSLMEQLKKLGNISQENHKEFLSLRHQISFIHGQINGMEHILKEVNESIDYRPLLEEIKKHVNNQNNGEFDVMKFLKSLE